MAGTYKIDDQWRMLVEEGQGHEGRRRVAHLFGMFPSKGRCRICKMPFDGLSGQIMHAIGKGPSVLNPHLCSDCDVFVRSHPGGVETRLSMLFADIRGSTSLAEHMKPTEFSRLIDRFFATATEILSRTDAIVDKLAGDQVSGYYVAGLAGQDHARVAVQAAQELLRATENKNASGAWISLGIGVHTGEAFFGAVGAQGGIVDVTALGDAVNIAARLSSNAGPGEILVSEETCRDAKLDVSSRERREMVLKGRSEPVSVYVLGVTQPMPAM
ncbi:MAG: adenylate/guanylate cyclase domain-containing protein [Anaerolineaceae bacterium]|nr:adenylate/guanylate cyclase domain-containing protein [Anaerolineaceae bacterium]